MTTPREDAIAALMESGKTREQAEALLSIARSAFARRGWIDGEPDTQEQLSGHVDRFIGDPS